MYCNKKSVLLAGKQVIFNAFSDKSAVAQNIEIDSMTLGNIIQ